VWHVAYYYIKKIYPKNKKNIENTVDRRVTDDEIHPLSFLLSIPSTIA
jgi:hypothetical protein